MAQTGWKIDVFFQTETHDFSRESHQIYIKYNDNNILIRDNSTGIPIASICIPGRSPGKGMQRILVIVNARHYPWEALNRAVALANRIEARVFVLRVFHPDDKETWALGQGEKTPAERRLENIIQTARTASVTIEYFVTQGEFEEEVIRFVEYNNISLLVVEPGNLEEESSEKCEKGKVKDSLGKFLHQISCRVEVVSQKRDVQNQNETKR
jgi:K+-sensing histidine kinase KdpD